MCTSVIGQVRTVDAGGGKAALDVDGEVRTVSLVTLELEGIAVVPGDWVHVHTGFAVEVLDPGEACALVAEQRAARAASGPARLAGVAGDERAQAGQRDRQEASPW
jgi:hydrogenase assembly chaperone HypC/HupF